MPHKVLVSIDVTSEQLELISSSGDVEITVKNEASCISVGKSTSL